MVELETLFQVNGFAQILEEVEVGLKDVVGEFWPFPEKFLQGGKVGDGSLPIRFESAQIRQVPPRTQRTPFRF